MHSRPFVWRKMKVYWATKARLQFFFSSSFDEFICGGVSFPLIYLIVGSFSIFKIWDINTLPASIIFFFFWIPQMTVIRHYSAFITHLYGIMVIQNAQRLPSTTIINSFIRFHCHVNEKATKRKIKASVDDHEKHISHDLVYLFCLRMVCIILFGSVIWSLLLFFSLVILFK